jgi:hypothetical protein
VRHSRSLHFALGAVLLVIGALVHGIVGAALAFSATLVVIDGLVPPPGVTLREADERFCRAVRHRRRASVFRRMTLRAPERLVVLDEGAYPRRHDLGVQLVEVLSVAGTVEPVKAREFDGCFRPSMPLREHWKRVWVAEGLPPIAVYRVEGRCYVIDGHHRVSTARDHGAVLIEAMVTELAPPAAAPR